MSLRSAKAMDYLKSKYEGDERIRGMQFLNLIRDFELLLTIANRVRLLGSSLPDSRIVEKILVTVPERFEASITTLENTKDFTGKRRVMRQDGAIEGALPIKHHMNARNNKTKKGKKHQGSNGEYTTNNNMSIVGNKMNPILHVNIVCTKCKLSSTKTKISNMVKRHRLLIKRRINCSWLHASLAWNQVRVVSLTVVALTT
ncbi:hypothetical protein AAG906_021004 [Vitis piasezkii]